VILTGTPEGVGMGRTPKRWLNPGDVCEIDIEGIGILKNACISEVVA
jgi:2-keto-4-pentenoate hydratase/2-oxohepta-3-ene-1,7-dioic acid hydratase in catechol pathway